MKIAREIADVFEPHIGSVTASIDRVLRPAMTRENLEAVIAAKLEPVREILALARNCLPGNDMLQFQVIGDTSVGRAALAIEQALAIFEEDS